jgi:hypothetical protein
MLSWTRGPTLRARHLSQRIGCATADYFQRLDGHARERPGRAGWSCLRRDVQREVVTSFIAFGLADFVQSKSQLPRRSKLASDRSASV